MGYLCDNHPDTPAAVTVTNLDTGDVVALCGPDVHEWMAAMAAATAPQTVTPQDLTESGDPVTGDPTHDDSAGDGPTSPGAPAPAESPAPTPEPEADPVEDDDLPDLADLLAEARPGLADDEEHVTTDA
jgi:hypothetical protein